MSIPITAQALARACSSSAAAAVAIEVVAQTGSTNADLLSRIVAPAAALSLASPSASTSPSSSALPSASPSASHVGLTTPTLLLAHRQSAGRGRAGRSWLSDASSLTFSLAWGFEAPLMALVGLPLAVGVAVADVLAARGVKVTLKWPNDVLLDGGKLAGILIETASVPAAPGASRDPGAQVWAVIGIGINLHDDGTDAGHAGSNADTADTADTAGTAGTASTAGTAGTADKAGTAGTTGTADAADAGQAADALAVAVARSAASGAAPAPIARLPPTDPTQLMAALLDSLALTLTGFANTGFAPWAARWNALHAHDGHAVDIIDRGRVIHAGRAIGVDRIGRLLLATGQGQVAIMAGDVSLRAAGKVGDAVAD